MKYLGAYLIPIIGLLGIYNGSIWTYSAFMFAFVLVPILEITLPIDKKNDNTITQKKKNENWIYNLMLYINILLVYGAIIMTALIIKNNNLTWFEAIGTTLSLGIILGANGINVAHELGHRENKTEKIMAKILLIPSHYTHFFIEHNHGHHVHVSTPNDPSTAKYNQNLYAFWYQTVLGTYTKAWEIQLKLNETNNRKWYSINNDMLWFTIIQLGYLVTTYIVFGQKGMIFLLFAGIVGFLLLETINYIEHYGLKRKQLESGRFERVSEKHSWNSNHIIGRIILYELTRHSDHHYKSQKKYQVLEYHDVSPQMPYGYPTSMVLSFFPTIWFKIMNKRIPHEMK